MNFGLPNLYLIIKRKIIMSLENRCIDLLNRISKLYTSDFNDIKIYKFKILQLINEIKLLSTKLSIMDSLWAKNYFIVLNQEQIRLQELLDTITKLDIASTQDKLINQIENLNNFKHALNHMEDNREKD